jgi:hypothetical protein
MSKKKYIPFEDKFTVKHVDFGGNHFDKGTDFSLQYSAHS